MREEEKVPILERALGVKVPYNEYASEPIQREQTEEEKLEQAFLYHPPYPEVIIRYNTIRAAAKALSLVILQNVPRCADRTAAIRKVREAVMTSNAAIALNGLI